jgi:hypothetical protein
MQQEIRKPREALQRAGPIEIGMDRRDAQTAQIGGSLPGSNRRINAVAPREPRQRPAGDVSAADDQESLHLRIISRRLAAHRHVKSP